MRRDEGSNDWARKEEMKRLGRMGRDKKYKIWTDEKI